MHNEKNEFGGVRRGTVRRPFASLPRFGGAAGSAEHHGVGHIASAKQLTTILLALLFLTVVTVAASWFNFGSANLFIAMLIAFVKASLVVQFFMHMIHDRPLNKMVLMGSLLFVALFLALALIDTTQYQREIIPGYAPLVKQ